MNNQYSAGEFSQLTGSTKRTLHYYDQIGLLKPERKYNGYRYYTTKDLLLLQQIVTLKFLGLPASKIKSLLKDPNQPLKDTLTLQAKSLSDKAKTLKNIAKLMLDVVALMNENQKVNWYLVANAIKTLQTNKEESWYQNFFTEHEFAELDTIWRGLSDQEVYHYIKIYSDLVTSINNNLHTNPESSVGKKIAKQFYKMSYEVYGHKPHLMKKMLISYRMNMISSEFMPQLSKKAYNYLIKALKSIGKLEEFI